MPKPSTTAREAIERALAAIDERRSHFPCMPQGWPEKAKAALASNDDVALTVAGLELRVAHGQYSADFDNRIPLFELREAFDRRLKDYVEDGLPVAHLIKALPTNHAQR